MARHWCIPLLDRLRYPPRDLVAWITAQRDPATAWRSCPRGSWLLILLEGIGADWPSRVLCACDCAREALPGVPDGDERPRLAIEATEAWAAGRLDGRVAEQARAEAARCIAEHDRAFAEAIRAASLVDDPPRAAAEAAAALGSARRAEARIVEVILGRRWPQRVPKDLDRCRPALQVAWDLCGERSALSTAGVLDAFFFHLAIEPRVHRPNRPERRLLAAVAEGIAASADPGRTLAEVERVLGA